tara:strand:- start:4196 stop:4735 length:540 start_codon:yes stop_codon:yes gene_type:complete
MPSKSKSKGSGYEREQAKFLSEKYNGSFVRVPNSGAFIGGSNFHRATNLSEGQVRGFKGDIIPPDNWKYFNCECKFYKEFPWHHLLYDKKIPLLEDWIVQTMEIAEDSDVNIIFMKFNRIGTYVAYQEHMNGIGWRSPISVTYKSEKNGCWIITSAEEFWKYNSDAFERHCIDGAISSD